MSRFPQQSDSGFTLLEVLLAILVMALVLPVIGATLYMTLRTEDETNKRLLDSHDIQTAGAFFGSDVQNATAVSTSDTSTCVASAYTVTNPVILLTWVDRSNIDGSTTSHSVNYYVSGTQLIRSACAGGAGSSALIVVHGLDPAVTPSVQCQPTACTANPVPPSVALRGKTADSAQMFSLIGTRRTS